MRFAGWLALAVWVAACSSSGPVSYVGDDTGLGDGGTEVAADVLDEEDETAADLLEDAPTEMTELDGADLPDEGTEGPDTLADTAPEDLAAETGGDGGPEEVVPEPLFDVELLEANEDAPWASVRLYSVDHPALGADKFIEKIAHSDPKLAALFGGQTEPSADRFLLHVGPGCTAAPDRAVFLVHGAGGNADLVFVDPDLMGKGLAPRLMDEGLCVFAITFPHPFGNNFNQAIQLAAAMEQARLLAGVERLDLVTHSKGGIVALTYAAGFAQKELGVDYAGDVDRLFLLGVPMAGTDFSFRHPAFNYPVDLYNLTMPSSWDKILEWGVWKDLYNESIYGGAFDGVLQTLAAWDEVYALSVFEQDWYTTYYGGDGFVSHSLGIAKAMEMGGNFMAKLRQHTLPESVGAVVVSGGSALIGGVVWEGTGPSDGLVFEDSAQDKTMLTTVVGEKHFALLNHWDLVAASSAQDWVVQELQK